METIMKNKKISDNPYIIFLPFLIIYIIVILIFAKTEFRGDEDRYLMFAKNITHGFYTLPPPYLDLGNGPGYSMLLAPFVALKLPLLFMKLMNAVFYYLSVVLLFKSLRQIVVFKSAVIFSIIWALYPNTFEQLPYLLPEVFSSSLIPLIIFFLIKAFKNDDAKKINKYFIYAGLSLGYLALTKPIFGYVLIFMIAAIFLLWITNLRNLNYKKSITVLIVAFITTVPWLFYTYHMTGKMLYWSSFGGNNLYWMSSPYENEYGNYTKYPFPTIDNKYMLPGSAKEIKLNHEKDFEQILENKEAQKLYIKNGVVIGSPYTGVIQDTILKRIAIQNIKSHPLKFIENCFSNAGRIIFNYPADYTIQKPSTLLRLPLNGTLIVFSVFSLVFTLPNWRKIMFPIRFLLFFGLIYFGGSLLGSAGPRMFTIIVPILLIWIALIISKSVRIKMNW